MDEDSPDGCYGTRCADCKYIRAPPGSADQLKCFRLYDLAMAKIRREELEAIQ